MKQKLLVTHPGRYGDCLWALPTVRALSETFRTKIDLLLSPNYSSDAFRELLHAQPYVGHVFVNQEWEIVETAPMTPRIPPNLPPGYDRIIHLGYDGWPSLTLPYEMCGLAEKQVPLTVGSFNLAPWIGTPWKLPCDIAVGFSEEYYELKYGLDRLLWEHCALPMARQPLRVVNVSGGHRWDLDNPWTAAASWIAGAKLFVGCCSALHVLACAVGTPVLLVEPAPARHHDIFYPFGKLGPQVQLLTGGDGLPTFDSRHLTDAVDARLGLVGATA